MADPATAFEPTDAEERALRVGEAQLDAGQDNAGDFAT